MPVVRIDFDGEKITLSEAQVLSRAIQKIVSEETGIEDVIVYANDSQVKVHVWPIEIFVQMSEHKIQNEEALFASLKDRIVSWKKEQSIAYPINLTFIPLKWKIETGL